MKLGKKVESLLTEEYISERTPPVNYSIENEKHFSKEFRKVIPSAHLITFTNAYVTNLGRVIHNMRIVKESDINRIKAYDEAKYIASSFLLKRNNLLKEDKYLLIFNSNWQGYFHWITECLIRLFVLKDSLSNYVLLLPHDLSNYQKKSLEPFNLKKMVYINKGELNFVPNLAMPTHLAPTGNYNKEVISKFSMFFTNYFAPPKTTNRLVNRKIYISRAKAPRRKVVNDQDVAEELMNYGYEIIYMEDYSFMEQINLCSQCVSIISMHGAGLTNILFMPKGGSVIEFRHEDDFIRNCYFTLASDLDLNYYYLLCQKPNKNESPTTADSIVDIKKLKILLEKF